MNLRPTSDRKVVAFVKSESLTFSNKVTNSYGKKRHWVFVRPVVQCAINLEIMCLNFMLMKKKLLRHGVTKWTQCAFEVQKWITASRLHRFVVSSLERKRKKTVDWIRRWSLRRILTLKQRSTESENRCIMPLFAEKLHAKCQFMTSWNLLFWIKRNQTKEMQSYHATWYFWSSLMMFCRTRGHLVTKINQECSDQPN